MTALDAKVVVTGAGGFIGSHVVEQLLAAGHTNVVAFIRYTSMGTAGWLERLPSELRDRLSIVRGDIRDAWSVMKLTEGASTIFHLAALISIPYSYVSPDAYVQTNIQGTLNVLESARLHGVRKVVVTSTSEVYGTALRAPIDEEHPLQAQSPYSASKISADQLALSYYRSVDLPVAVIRPFNCYGPRQSTRAVIPTIIAQLKSGNGTIRLGSTSPTRDFTFVDDTARAFLDVAKSEATIGRVLNIGSGAEISIGDLASRLQAIAGTTLPIEASDERVRPAKSEVFRLIADCSAAKQLLGWKPRVTLDEGLERTFQWFSNPENLALYQSSEYRV